MIATLEEQTAERKTPNGTWLHHRTADLLLPNPISALSLYDLTPKTLRKKSFLSNYGLVATSMEGRVTPSTSFLFVPNCHSLICNSYACSHRTRELAGGIYRYSKTTRLPRSVATLPATAAGLPRGITPSHQPRSSAQLSNPSKETLKVQFPPLFSGRKGGRGWGV